MSASWANRVVGCRAIVLIAFVCSLVTDPLHSAEPGDYFGIRVTDAQTGRGVPLVELETVNHVRWVTDSAGWAAICEPDLMGQEVFFFVRSHGYRFPEDGFGFAGVRLQVESGKRATIRIERQNLAERLYRITGQGIYRDSLLLGEPTPLAEPLGSGRVAGQDSAFAIPYDSRVFWFWGDTSRLSYPLGHFWMAAAHSDVLDQGGLDPAVGVQLDYFVDEDGFSRPVARLGVERGVIWADGFTVLRDPADRERLVCHYAHMESLSKMLGHGLAVFDDQREEFESLKKLDMDCRHLFPGQAHPICHRMDDVDYLFFGEVFPNVRVRANWEDWLDPDSYEGYTCLAADTLDGEDPLLRDERGNVRYEWRRGAKPIDGATEKRLIDRELLAIDQARFLPRDIQTNEPVIMHRGSVRWNAYRNCWIMIATQVGGTSHLGEVWYAEAPQPTGPWRRTVKIVTHDQYSFYNPVHHAFFDQDGGRLIYFEGTYTQTFSGNPTATPRYDYNQIMYRLDLSQPRLTGVRRP